MAGGRIAANFGGVWLMRYLPQDERDIPLAVKYETSAIWPDIKASFGVGPTGAAIAMALFDAALLDRMVSYSRSRSYYDSRNNHPLLGYKNVLGAVNALEAAGLIAHKKQRPGGRGWQSSMAGNSDFVEAMTDIVQPLPLAMPRKLVLLRDKEGRPIDAPRNREVGRLEKGVAAVNEALASVEVRGADGLNLDARVARIFNGDMSRGGRFYGLGTSWQNIPSDDRLRIQIDGEPVVELDFSTLHPALLYAEVGAPVPDDCYIIGNWPRSLVKRGLLVLINARNWHSARSAIAYCDDMAVLEPFDRQDALQFASRLIANIKARHRPIAKFFHSDAGARLMRKDSDLAAAILARLRRKGIVALPVHDSFLVAEHHADELEAAMHECAAEQGLITCRVERVETHPPILHM